MARLSPRRRMLLVAVAMTTTPLVSPVLADTIRLTDGNTLHGEAQKTPNGWVITQADGKKVTVPSDRIAAIETAPRADVAAERLASIRRSAENVSDAKQVLEWYRAFVLKYPGTPSVELANKEIAIWEDRVARKLVKVAGRWVDEKEKQQVGEQSVVTAEQAFDLIRQARHVEATGVVERAIAENPNNAAAWYLKGLIAWKADKAPDARKAFEKVVELMSDHAPSHQNLGVVLWRQNQHVTALLSYDRALTAAPGSRFILDNLAEALAALPTDLRDRTTVGRVVRHFNEQDAILQQQMAAKAGLFRWGSSWVSKLELDKLKAAERDIRTQIDRLEIQYNANADRLRQVDFDIATSLRTMRDMEANAIAFDPATGRRVQYPLPPSYYDFARDVTRLEGERRQRQDAQQGLKRQALLLSQNLPKPLYSGQQRVIDWEGTPILGPKALAAMPAPAAQPPVPANPVQPAAPQPPLAQVPQPAAPNPAPAAQPERPRVYIPPEKPSIMERSFNEPIPGPLPLPERPRYEEPR